MMLKFSALRFAVFVCLLCLLVACEHSAKTERVFAPACQEQTKAQITYQLNEADETLFALQAWLLWVSEEDLSIESTHYDESYRLLLQRFHQEKYRQLRARHRLAYEQYRQQDSLLMANGYLLMNQELYAQAPSFEWEADASLSPEMQKRLSELPEPVLIAEFYQEMNLGDFWRTHLQSRIKVYSELYRSAALEGFQRTACFLGLVGLVA